MTILPMGFTQKGCEEFLKNAYTDVVRKQGLIDFTAEIRTEKKDFSGKYSVKQARLDNLFSGSAWKEITTKSGHRKLTNEITHVVVEYGNHEKDIDPGAAKSVFDAVQEHINMLFKIIYPGKVQSWKVEPDYKGSVARWSEFIKK